MSKRGGFTLLEVLIALTVITITFVAVTSLVSRNLQTNLLNQSYITGHYLNSEAIEIVRNMRDSNWLQNFSFNADTERLWGESLWPNVKGQVKVVQVDRRREGGNSPWIMRATVPDFEANRFYIQDDGRGKERFSHTAGSKTTRFARYIELEIVTDAQVAKYQDRDLEPLKVTAVTVFTIGGKEREVRYSTLLTDWKQGPL